MIAYSELNNGTDTTQSTPTGEAVIHRIYITYVDDSMTELLTEIRKLSALRYLKEFFYWDVYQAPKMLCITIKLNRKNNRQMLIKRRYNQGIHSDTKIMATLLILMAIVYFLCW